MNNTYRYQLEKGSKKYICPSCQKRRFVRFVDQETNNYLPIEFGRCDRSDKCGYILNPYSHTDFKNKSFTYHSTKDEIPYKTTYIPNSVLTQTKRNVEASTFIQNLRNQFCYNPVKEVISHYQLGGCSTGYRKGAVTFPFIDINQNVRAIQVKQFDHNQKTTSTDFIHSIIEKYHLKKQIETPEWIKNYKSNERVISCLFGEHLLNAFPNNPIALVEAPKTAIYGMLNFGSPIISNNYLWLSVYNVSSLTYEKASILQGRKVVLYPDTSVNGSAFKLWKNKADIFNRTMNNTQFKVSTFLEKQTSQQEKRDGVDLADFLIPSLSASE